MNHLSPAEFVDAADRALAPARAAHLERCERCRTQMASVRAGRDAAGAADVPEPSPLYWQHLSANIRDRVADEAIVPAWRAASWREWLGVRTLVPLTSALVLAAAAFVAILRPGPPPVDVGPVPVVAGVSADAPIEPENADVWQVLTAAAADVRIEDAHEAGMHVPSAAIDGAVQRMTPAERNELGRLLQSELRGSGN